MSAHQKSQLGMNLSPEDLRVLLNSPDSWVRRIYLACAASLAEAKFIEMLTQLLNTLHVIDKHYLETIERENATAPIAAQQRESMARAAAFASITDTRATQVPIDYSQLTTELMGLLAQPQSSMSLPQLVQHHHQIMHNVHSHVLASLGPSITLSVPGTPTTAPSTVTLAVPLASAIPPAISAAEVIAINPNLRKATSEDSAIAQGFAIVHAKATTGYHAVMRIMKAILDENEIELTTSAKMHLFKQVDANVATIVAQVDAIVASQRPKDSLLSIITENSQLSMASYQREFVKTLEKTNVEEIVAEKVSQVMNPGSGLVGKQPFFFVPEKREVEDTKAGLQPTATAKAAKSA